MNKKRMTMLQTKKNTYQRVHWYVLCLMVLVCTSFSHALSAAHAHNMGNHYLRQNNTSISIEENNILPSLVTFAATNEHKESSIPIAPSKKKCKQQPSSNLPKKGILQHRLKVPNIRVQNQKNFACHTCGKSFNQISNLTRHIKNVHCQKGFSQKTNLKRHMLKHTGVRPYAWALCNPSCIRKENFKRYLQNFHARNKFFVCIVCDKRYARRVNLIRHQKNAHVQEKPYKCSQCNKSFTRRDTLKRHMSNHL